MAKKKFKTKLSIDGINNLIAQLEDYEHRINRKLVILVNRLAEAGISVAKQNIKVEDNELWIDRSNLVYFEKDVKSTVDGATCIVVPFSTPYVTRWKKSADSNQILTAEVDPLLMAEFGSGAKAIDGHRGTFPNQKHANQDTWGWYDEYGVFHWSIGSVPTRPIYKAKEEILQQINNIATEVFSTL